MLKKVLLSAVAICMILACAFPFEALAEQERKELQLPYSQTDLKGILSVGSKGINVMRVQKRLKYYGFYYYGTVNPDGIYGNTLKQAVIRFQRANNLKVDGKVGYNTWALLISDTAVKKSDDPLTNILVRGDHGTEVEEMQDRLKYYGYYTGKVDGSFGSQTENAVRAFQAKNGLKVDGKIGEDTRSLLRSNDAIAKTDPTFERIEKGDTGARVVEIQNVLYATYYYDGNIDGIFDNDVRTAVINFQQSAGLQADGIVGEKTYNALVNGTARIFNGGSPKRTLQRTMRGYDVYVLQQKLAEMNYLNVIPHWGYYDNDTVAAVKSFQKNNHINESGVCDIQVRRYIWPSETVPESEEETDSVNTTLRMNDHGAAVANLQMRLKAAGYLIGDSDSIFGTDTEKAVKSLQKKYGAKVDGICGPITWAILQIELDNVDNAEPELVDPEKHAYTTPLRKLYAGTSGVAVTKLQQMLVDAGFLSSSDVDGKFGPITKQAVIDFQTSANIAADGIVGSKTYVALYEALGIN